MLNNKEESNKLIVKTTEENALKLFINRNSKLFMIQLMVSNIIDEHCDYHFKDVHKIFKERVKEKLILAGAGNLAGEPVLNYIGPRPKLADDPLFANLKKDEEKTENE